MPKKRIIPHYSHTFLHRQGIKIMPSENFLNKFKEEYQKAFEESYEYKLRKNYKIDDEMAIFFIITIFESIIYCLDFGFDVFLFHLVVFKTRISDYINNIKRKKESVYENVKKITFRLYSKNRLTMAKNANIDNEEYQEYLEKKKENYSKIKKYYKEFYNKTDEWWTYD